MLHHQGTTWLIDGGRELTDPEQVGYKFARQVALTRDGFPVPPLVCVPATVFDSVVGPELTSVADPTSATDLSAWAQGLRLRVQQADFPAGLRRELDERFDELAGPGGLVAVRACVVARRGEEESGEDSAQDPFAGLSDSYLYVGRGGLAERVVACWASAFNPEAVLYRARRGLNPLAARVAVGIQRMAMGTRSFVAFTRDPRDGSDRHVIAAAHGIGEGVVQEKADVDHFFVDPVTGRADALIATKTRAVGWDPARPLDGPVALPVDERLAALPVLDDAEVKAITELAGRVAVYFGEAQDIEGTITEDGTIHLVQARPVVAAPRPLPCARDERPAPGIVWDNSNVTESFPGVSSALTFSVARELYEVGFTDLYRRMGVPARTLHRNRADLRRMVGHLNGRIYYQLDVWYRMHSQIRCFRLLWSTWEQALGLPERNTARSGTRGRQVGRLAKVAHATEILVRLALHPWRVRRFLTWWDAFHEQFADVSAMRPHEAVAAYRELWSQVARRWGVTLVNGVFLFAATLLTNGLLRRWLPGADRSLLNGMLVGGTENRSAAALRSLVALAATAAASPALRDALLSDTIDHRNLWDELTAGHHGADFGSAVREHVRVHGDRGLHDLKLETVTPRDEPWTVLATVRAFVRQGRSVEATRAVGQDVRRRAERELRERCHHPLKRAALKASFAAMRTLMRVREDTRFCRSQLFGDTRALLLRLGAELAAAGRLDRPRDVLHLTADEVLGAFDGTLAGADLRGLAAVRAAERTRWAESDESLPTRLETDPDVPLAIALESAGIAAGRSGEAGEAPPGDDDEVTASDVLSGLASSAGTVRGRAKIVTDPSITADECADRILVARETDPGWLVLMMSARALVVERGTLLSHTAITGRLLGIPTVVSVPNATARIADGSLVEVDGAAGTVRLLEDAS